MTMTIKLTGDMKEVPINPIRHARMKHGLTQKQLADMTGIPHRTIQNWESGQRECHDYVAKMVLNLLDSKLSRPDYQTILEEVLDMMESDLKGLKTAEARKYVSNVVKDIKDSLNKG